MKDQIYKDGILNAIKILDDEVQLLRALRDRGYTEKEREHYTSTMLAHITSILHLKEVISDGTEEE